MDQNSPIQPVGNTNVSSTPTSPAPQQTISQPVMTTAAPQAQQQQLQQPNAVPYTVPSPYTQASSSRSLFTWLIPAAALLLLIFGVFGAPQLFSITKADYREAYTLTEKVRTAYDKLSLIDINSANTSEEMKKNLDDLDSARLDFSVNFYSLSQMKAVKKDKELKQLYNEAQVKELKYGNAIAAVLEMYEKVYPAVAAAATDTNPSVQTLTYTRKTLESVNGLIFTENKTFVEDSVKKLKELEELATKIETDVASGKKTDPSVASAYAAAAEDFAKITLDWQSTIDKDLKDGDLRAELKKLSENMKAKSS